MSISYHMTNDWTREDFVKATGVTWEQAERICAVLGHDTTPKSFQHWLSGGKQARSFEAAVRTHIGNDKYAALAISNMLVDTVIALGR